LKHNRRLNRNLGDLQIYKSHQNNKQPRLDNYKPRKINTQPQTTFTNSTPSYKTYTQIMEKKPKKQPIESSQQEKKHNLGPVAFTSSLKTSQDAHLRYSAISPHQT